MKTYLPFVFAGLGLVLVTTSFVLRWSTGDTDAITNISCMFMLVGGIVCIGGGVLTYFLRDNPEVW